MAGILNSSLNGSASSLPEASGRSFASFSAQAVNPPVFHHSVHSMSGNFNISNMPVSLASRNSTMNVIPPTGIQPSGPLSNGRYASNNFPVSLSQVCHGHSSINNKGGYGISQLLGNSGPRVVNSMGNMVDGNLIGSTIGYGGGLSIHGFSSRGNLDVQGSSRLISAPQAVSMIGNPFANSTGMLNEINSNESSPFDINDFPQLTGRPTSAGGPQGQLGSLRNQGGSVSSIVQQNQEFIIQNEDFPALPRYKDLHQKEPAHDNTMPMIQSHHYSMGRSVGFPLGATFSPQHHQQHSPINGSGVSFLPSNSQDLRLHGSDLFPSSHGDYLSQVNGALEMSLRHQNIPFNCFSGMGSYEQFVQQYQAHHKLSQVHLHRIPSINQPYRDQSMESVPETQVTPDQFGILGLLSVIKMSHPAFSSLALGIDLTTLGLNLSSTSNLHKTFGSPLSNGSANGVPDYSLPECYNSKQPPPLHEGLFSRFKLLTLFYIFYSMPKDEAQLYAANELYSRGWFYHKEFRLWFINASNREAIDKTDTYERGRYHYFDPRKWETQTKDDLVILHNMVEERPSILQHQQNQNNETAL